MTRIGLKLPDPAWQWRWLVQRAGAVWELRRDAGASRGRHQRIRARGV